MAQLSDDCFAHGGRLMRTEEALELLAASLVRVTEAESVPLTWALGRILAEDVVSPHDVPPHDNSAVDGYAVFFDDLDAEGDTALPIAGRARAGHPLVGPAPRGKAVRIFTGAPMPEGMDSVMMQEDCRIEGERVVLRPGLKRGANRRLRGEDIRAGGTVLSAGLRLRPQDLGQAAAVGRRELIVSRRLRVALFSTGDELREPGATLEAGCIYDSNRTTIHGLLTGLGCAVEDLGILADDPETLRAALQDASEGHDLVVTSGGVSVGEDNIVRPMILRLMGGTGLTPHHFRVPADFSHKKKKDRREWLRARLVSDGGTGWRAVKFPRQGAGILSSLVEAEGLVELPEEMTALEPGTLVDFLPFSEVAS
jgi:molybdopterin molybdotransferase